MRNMNCQRMHSSPQNSSCGFGMSNIDTDCQEGRRGCGSRQSNCQTDRSGCSSRQSNCQTDRCDCSSRQSDYQTDRNRQGCCQSRCDRDSDGRGPCNRISDDGCDKSSSRYNDPLLGMPVGIGYVPWQQWSCLFDLETGLKKGTMFPALALPFRACIPNCHSHKGGAL